MTVPVPASMSWNAPPVRWNGSAYVPAGGGGGGGGRFTGLPRRTAQAIERAVPRSQAAMRQPMSERVPVPGWMADRKIVIAAWAVAMVLVGVSDHQQGYLLPRPARLWSTSAVYFILAMAGSVPEVVPIVNAFAIGMVIVLALDYYNTTGIFTASASPAAPGGGPATQSGGVTLQ